MTKEQDRQWRRELMDKKQNIIQDPNGEEQAELIVESKVLRRKLIKGIKMRDRYLTENCFRDLIVLRGEQLKYTLNDLHRKNEEDYENKKKKCIEKYIIDCGTLLVYVDRMKNEVEKYG